MFSQCALMNFMERGGWSIHIIAEDCKTALVDYRRVANQEPLLSMITRMGGSAEVARQHIRRWGRDSVWIDPSPAECKALGIRVLPGLES